MPAIQLIECTKNTLLFTDAKGTYKFDTSNIPPDKDSIAKLEDYLNTQWLPPLLNGEYQMQVHVFSLSPLSLTAYTANPEEKIPTNWWLDDPGTVTADVIIK